MDTLEAISTRRSIPKYLDQPVPEELIEKLLAAAMQAPSARNQQPWQFMLIDDRALPSLGGGCNDPWLVQDSQTGTASVG